MNTLYADIILPFPLDRTFTYKVPDTSHAFAVRGMRAEVSFRNKIYTGVVFHVHELQPTTYHVKEIVGFPDDSPVITEQQLQLWEWMAGYYMCSMGEVYNAAVPALFKLGSSSIIVLNQDVELDSRILNDREFLIAEALTMQKELSMHDVQQILQIKNVQPVLRTLIQKGVINIKEEIRDAYKPKTVKVIELDERYEDEQALQELFASLDKVVKQQHLLMVYYQMVLKGQEVRKAALMKKAGVTPSVLQSMVKKQIFHEVDAEISRLKKAGLNVEQPKQLTAPQMQALEAIQHSFKEKDVVLLHGVTGSGKTEIYMELIQSQIDQGQQVLYLLPEIALTAQIINRLRKRFGDAVGVYHSKFNHSERIEIWQHVQDGKYKILLGARSALYLPFLSPGLVIVDEEHDYSFKQQDPAPRYHARDTAIYLATIWRCKTLLGTATPSVESYHNAIQGKYGYVELKERYAGMLLPEIRMVDMKVAAKEKKLKAQFSTDLLNEIEGSITSKEQVILFQNRRGYSPFIVCEQCGWTPHCINCDVNLVYHKIAGELRCHYCGYKHEVWHDCPECGSTRLLVQGFGTEKIEEELQLLYPELRIARLDLDAVKTKSGHDKVLTDFEDGQVDVLVGTQMVTKGLDFDNVNLVGILSADQILNFADFRSAERGYQLMMQVSGRAGRKNRQGLVMIQAMNVKHPVLQWVIKHETHQFYEEELRQRQKFAYPPFVRLVRITIKHKDKSTAEYAAKAYIQAIGIAKHFKVLGPVQPPIGRLRNKYLYEIVVKMEVVSGAFSDTKNRLKKAREVVIGIAKFKSVDIVPDVDPI